MTTATLADLLRDIGNLDEDRVEECLRLRKETGQSLDKIVTQKGYLDETAMLRLFSEYLGYEYRASLREESVPPDFLQAVPVQFARSYNLVAVEQENGTLRVATCSPMDVHPMDELAGMVGLDVEPVLSPRSEITALVNRSYKHRTDLVDEALDNLDDEDIVSLSAEIEDGEDILDVAHKAPIIKLVNMVLFQALKMRASDVHIHPFSDRVQVRYRIDGILYDMESAPKKVQDAIISRVKVMSKMDIAERRLPQDGRATLRLGHGEVDVRISTVPTNHGERICMRLLDKTSKVLTLNDIGLDQYNRDILEPHLLVSHGMIFLTGPTGSGKTTTLYAAMSQMDTKRLNVLTIEDPIEYNLDGVSQVQVNEKKGLTFASGLRSFLRQDPDVMMVGEVRDRDTADIAIRAALTGHLVFSTVHTNDAPSTVTRLLDIGIEPYLVASSLLLVIAQRLVRKNCPRCRMEVEPDVHELKKLDALNISVEDLPGGLLTVGKGCEYCFGSGYVERTALYEMLKMDDDVKDLIMDRSSASRIKEVAVRNGMRTLRLDGVQKVLQGITTVDEVLRVTQL